MKSYPISPAQDLINQAHNILIALPRGANLDQIAAGLALYLSLQKSGKQTGVVCPEPMRVELSRLVGVDRITDKVAGADLAILFNYPISGIEKVTSDEQDGKLRLIIRLNPGQPPLTAAQVVFSPVGATGDLIITLGTRKLEGLGKVYFDNKEFFEQKPIINIDNNSQNTGFGKVNIVDKDVVSFSEMVSTIIFETGLPMDSDISSNLLSGLRTATDNFQSSRVTADTFEVAAFALRTHEGKTEQAGTEAEPSPKAPPVAKQVPAESSPDWLEPKIYKGSTLP